MNIRTMDWDKDFKGVLKDVCKNSGSPITKQSHSFFPVMHYHSGDKVECEIFDDCAFYFAMRSKKAWRLVEIAVRQDMQRNGYGRVMLSRMYERMRAQGIHKLTFRTPMNESAQYFWLKMGAKIIDVNLKVNDYIMEININ